MRILSFAPTAERDIAAVNPEPTRKARLEVIPIPPHIAEDGGPSRAQFWNTRIVAPWRNRAPTGSMDAPRSRWRYWYAA